MPDVPIRVIIVEDNPDWIKLLTHYLTLKKDFLVVATAMNRDEALKVANAVLFDVMLVDINLCGNKYDGLILVQDVLEIKNVKVIMVTSMSGKELLKQSFKVGAVNFISKDNYKEIPNAIYKAFQDDTAMDFLLKSFWNSLENEKLSVLTDAEKEIFQLILEGYTHSVIAAKLNKAEGTIKHQIHSILKKLNARNCREAVERVYTKRVDLSKLEP